jgi:3-oxoacyl-[acyl-carrier protein] reductase
MNDIYTRAVQSDLGKSLASTFGLPTPPTLLRSPELSLSNARGQFLVAGATNARALRHAIEALASNTSHIMTPQWDDPEKARLFSNATQPKGVKVDSMNFNRESNHKFKALIFDGTGLKNESDLKSLYFFFHNGLKHLRENGRVIVLLNHYSTCYSVEQHTCREAALSFVRSLAKEIGGKGASANAIELEAGAERSLLASLSFFISRKSAYITGQSLSASKVRTQKNNWHKPLAGKTALVTGAAFGIGAETARVLARDGAVVVCLDIPANQALLTQFASNIGGHALAIDLSSESAVGELVQAITSQLGLVDIIVHNAGITRDKTLRKMNSSFWSSVMNINLETIMAINSALIDRKAINKNGRLICVSSISGIAGNFGQTNYASSKGGIIGYVESLARELEGNITINAVAPGFIETRMTSKVPLIPRELGRRSNSFSQGGTPLDVAEAISFFCHPGSQTHNGNILRVCGQSLLGK